MIQFENINNFYWLLILLFMLVIIYFFNKWKKSKKAIFNKGNVINKIILNDSYNRRLLKTILLFSSVFFLIIALTNPKIGTTLEEVKREGIEIMIALDVSNSMLCEDIEPNRILRAKKSISELIDKLDGDRIGLIIFAGEAYTQLPITSDYSAAKMFLQNINTSSIKTQGTNIYNALKQCMNSFNFDNDFNKSIIIITDGEDHEEGALDLAEEISEMGVFIHTLAFGDQGGPIPTKSGFKENKEGEIVITKPNFIFLSELANKGNGTNIIANNSEIGLKKLFSEINKIEKKEMNNLVYSNYANRFQIFLTISFSFLFMYLIILNKKNKKLNI